MKNDLEKRVEALEKIVGDLRKNGKKISKNLEAGDTFVMAGLEWKILDITEEGYCCLAGVLDDMKFGFNNDWKESSVREYLNGVFLKRLEDEVGAENVIPFERNLLSLDGQTEYGICKDNVSIISLDEYRQYRALIPNSNYYWWTLTPDSTAGNNDNRLVRVVCPSGVFVNFSYDGNCGVRPFCIFSSEIFGSENE